jgi:hypothetical protein
MSRYFASAAGWLWATVRCNELGWARVDQDDEQLVYETAWRDVQSIWGMGRYTTIKFLEYGRRHLGFNTALPDIRPYGGWSPRLALSVLYPEHEKIINGGNTEAEVDTVNRLAEEAKNRLLYEYKVDCSYFELQVCLCEYKQSYFARRQFPGRTHDAEMQYESRAAKYWGRCFPMYAARHQIFPHQCLGEVRGWEQKGVRKELGTTIRDHGYTWSDLHYDYLKTKDLANPVHW